MPSFNIYGAVERSIESTEVGVSNVFIANKKDEIIDELELKFLLTIQKLVVFTTNLPSDRRASFS